MKWLLVCVVCASGCRAPAAPHAGFLQAPEVLTPQEGIPFNAAWFKPGVDLRRYSKVYISPVNTDYLLQMDWWAKASFSGHCQKDEAEKLGQFFRERVQHEFGKLESPRVVDVPDAETLIINLALVEVVPTKTWLNVIGYVAAIPPSHGVTAFEAELRDGGTGEILAQFKDRQFGQAALVNIADLTWYGHSKNIVEGWANQIVKVITSTPGSDIERRPTVTLRPW